MKIPELIAIYLVVGAGCAIAITVRAEGPRIVDAMLLAGFWPLYGPFLLMNGEPSGVVASGDANGEVDLLVALRRAAATPLGKLLPDAETARALARRVRVASGKVAEIDGLLARRDFSENDAINRAAELKARGATDRALATAANRLQNIRRLRTLRDRFARELDEVRELVAQLSTQAEVVRLAGEPDASSAQLVRELVCRVEGLDEMFDGDLHLLD